MASADRNESFARKLAAVDKESRDAAVRSLAKWLATRDQISAVDAAKLWKALFYCTVSCISRNFSQDEGFWLSDKTPVQHELAVTLSNFIHTVPSASVWVWIEEFWSLIVREWIGIDRLRMDKYYMFLRVFTAQTFAYLRDHDWRSEDVAAFERIMSALPLSPASTVPSGIRTHVSDLYIDELNACITDDGGKKSKPPSDAAVLSLLRPFVLIAAECQDRISVARTIDNIFERILSESTSGELAFAVNGRLLSEALFEAGARESTLLRNRKELYRLSQDFKALAPAAAVPSAGKQQKKTQAAAAAPAPAPAPAAAKTEKKAEATKKVAAAAATEAKATTVKATKAAEQKPQQQPQTAPAKKQAKEQAAKQQSAQKEKQQQQKQKQQQQQRERAYDISDSDADSDSDSAEESDMEFRRLNTSEVQRLKAADVMKGFEEFSDDESDDGSDSDPQPVATKQGKQKQQQTAAKAAPATKKQQQQQQAAQKKQPQQQSKKAAAAVADSDSSDADDALADGIDFSDSDNEDGSGPDFVSDGDSDDEANDALLFASSGDEESDMGGSDDSEDEAPPASHKRGAPASAARGGKRQQQSGGKAGKQQQQQPAGGKGKGKGKQATPEKKTPQKQQKRDQLPKQSAVKAFKPAAGKRR